MLIGMLIIGQNTATGILAMRRERGACIMELMGPFLKNPAVPNERWSS